MDPIWLRPEQAPVGRPAERSRAEITAAAIGVADREGLDAASMRRVAAELGTGAASLYRYVATRDDLLDLMIDATAAEYVLAAPSGDAVADLVAVAEQSRVIMHRHRWLPELVATRGVLGPHGVDLLEHVLAVLERHPADTTTKLEAFAVLNGLVALFVQVEQRTDPSTMQRQGAYLAHVAAEGRHPRIAAALAGPAAPGQPGDRFGAVMERVLAGLLGDG